MHATEPARPSSFPREARAGHSTPSPDAIGDIIFLKVSGFSAPGSHWIWSGTRRRNFPLLVGLEIPPLAMLCAMWTLLCFTSLPKLCIISVVILSAARILAG